jgi:SSS family solute:Na+ symporter
VRLALELANGPEKAGLPDGTLWSWIAEINFLHYAVLLFVCCTALLIVVSLVTQPPAREQTEGITYGAAASPGAERAADRRRLNVILSVGLVAVIATLWIVFA